MIGRGLRVVGEGLLCAVAVGCASILLEVFVFLSGPGREVPVRFLGPGAFLYSFVWTVLALAIALRILLAGGISRGKALSSVSLRPLYLAVLLPVSLFLVGGGHVNLRFFPAFDAPVSLVFDALFLLFNVWLGVWIYRRGADWIDRVLPGGLRALQIAVIVVTWGLSVGMGERAEGSGEVSARPDLPTGPAAGPNVLLIAVDALRPDHMSAYGYERPTTPHLDQLASEGALFQRAFANSSWTKASVATIFTSLYPSTHGANVMATGVSRNLETLPEVMKRHGYATGIFSGNAFVSPLFGYQQGVDRFFSRKRSVFVELMLGHAMSRLRRYSPVITRVYRFLDTLELPSDGAGGRTDAPGLNAAFLEWIRGLEGRPFFAYFHYMEPHGAYEPPSPFDREYDPDYPGLPVHRHPIHQRFYPFSPESPLAPREFENLVAQYDGEVQYADEKLGELFEALRRMGLYDQTLILITADHGEEFYDHRGWGHGKSLFNELIRVPLIVRHPEIPGGRVVGHVAQHVDLMPTVLDAAGIRHAGHQEGRSLVEFLRDPEAPVEEPVVFSEVYHGSSYARSVIQEGFKLIRVAHYDQEAWFLFDLGRDPAEKEPLDPEQHPRAPVLKKLMEELYQRAQERQVAAETVEIDSSTKEELRALGYVQ